MAINSGRSGTPGWRGQVALSTLLLVFIPFLAFAQTGEPAGPSDVQWDIQEMLAGTISASQIDSLPEGAAGELLSYCAMVDRTECIDTVLDAGVPVDAQNAGGTTALFVAVGADSLAAAARLVQAGADPGLPGRTGTVEDFAWIAGSPEMIRLVVRGAAARGSAMLISAAETGDLDLMREALSLGADLDSAGPGGATPLALATARQDHVMMRALISAGARPVAAPASDVDPLAIAILSDDPLATEILLQAGANPNQPTAGVLPLSLAAMRGNSDVIDSLLAAGADRDLRNPDGSNAAMVAAAMGHGGLEPRLGPVPSAAAPVDLIAAVERGDADAVRVALEAGADPNIRDAAGNPAIVVAAGLGDTSSLRYLLLKFPDLMATGEGGASVLHAALAVGDVGTRVATVRALLRAVTVRHSLGRLVALVDASGRSAGVALAARMPFDHEDVAYIRRSEQRSQFASTGNDRDPAGMTPYMAAVLTDNHELITLFMEIAPPVVDPSGGQVSYQDVARSRQSWRALAALPDDRPIPAGLKAGASRALKREVQALLKDWGYYTAAIDGSFGPGSQAAMTAFLRDRRAELLSIGRAMERTAYSSMSYRTFPEDHSSNTRLTLTLRDRTSCTWRVVNWESTGSGSVSFVGCVSPEPNGAWNGNGVALVEYADGTEQLMLMGPRGWDDKVLFR